jgi:hypothetical protein
VIGPVQSQIQDFHLLCQSPYFLFEGVWNDDRYVVMKADAMSRDPKRKI